MVPVTSDGYFVFVVQPIALSKEGSLIEFPAGYIEDGEKEKAAGIRELAEETGYIPKEVFYLGNHYQDPGSIPQSIDVFLATNCEKLLEQSLDKGEYIKVVEISKDLSYELLDLNYFKDANTFQSFIKADRKLQKLKNNYSEKPKEKSL